MPDVVYVGGRGTVLRSEDGGNRWEESTLGDNEAVVESIRIHPLTQVLYATLGNCSCNSNLFKSVDAGRTWIQITSGLPLGDIILLDLSFDIQNGAILFVATTNGLFKSIDAGANWQLLGLENGYIRALAVDPRDANTLYVALGAKAPLKPGVMVSRDGGAHWRRFLSGQPTAMIVDPLRANSLYAGLWFSDAEQGIYRLNVGDRVTALQPISWGQLKAKLVR